MPVGAAMEPDVDKAQLRAIITSLFQKYGIDTSAEGFDIDMAVNGIMIMIEAMVQYIHQNAILIGVTPGAGTVPGGVK